jgi:hypothetical protein
MEVVTPSEFNLKSKRSFLCSYVSVQVSKVYVKHGKLLNVKCVRFFMRAIIFFH